MIILILHSTQKYYIVSLQCGVWGDVHIVHLYISTPILINDLLNVPTITDIITIISSYHVIIFYDLLKFLKIPNIIPISYSDHGIANLNFYPSTSFIYEPDNINIGQYLNNIRDLQS